LVQDTGQMLAVTHLLYGWDEVTQVKAKTNFHFSW